MYPQQSASQMFPSGGGAGKTFTVVVLFLLLGASLAFGFWAFAGRQDYKNNTDKKVAVAVTAAKTEAARAQQALDADKAKSPFTTYTGSPTYGSITFQYPRTWSAYVDSTNQSEPINGYFHPGVVPGVQSKTAFALRVELLNTDYSQFQQQFSGLIQQGTVTASAYVPPKMKGVANVVPGTYYTGQVNQQDPTQSGSLVAIKVRDKTLEIYTESNDFLSDFNNTILGSLTFAP